MYLKRENNWLKCKNISDKNIHVPNVNVHIYSKHVHANAQMNGGKAKGIGWGEWYSSSSYIYNDKYLKLIHLICQCYFPLFSFLLQPFSSSLPLFLVFYLLTDFLTFGHMLLTVVDISICKCFHLFLDTTGVLTSISYPQHISFSIKKNTA